MKIALFSDFHFHDWTYGSTTTSLGIGSRLKGQLDVMQDIIDHVQENNIKLTLFGGDLFHKFAAVDANVLHFVSLKIKELQRVTKLLLIPGNHDYANREGSITSTTWVPNASDLFEPQGGPPIVTIPYTESREQLLKRLSKVPDGCIVLGHQGVSGIPTESGFVLPNEILHPEDVPKNINRMFVGHYHNHRKISDQLIIIGAPVQHTASDVGSVRGWLDYDTETGAMTLVESKAPKFVKVKPFEIASTPLEGNFAILDVDSFDEGVEMSKQIRDAGAASCAVKVKEEGTALHTSQLSSFGFDTQTLFREYTKIQKIEGARLSVGEELLKEVE